MSETPNRVLFLDVDGVLNHLGIWKIGRPNPIDPECVARLNEVLGKTKARVVLSSAWRGLRSLEAKLRKSGALKRKYPRDWRTPQLHSTSKGGIIMARVRGDEIAAWLARHPEVNRYAIVDDDGDMLAEQMPYFVQTDFHDGGLKQEHADRLVEILETA